MNADIEIAVTPVAAAFESLGIEYYLAGSVISSHFGVPRATADVDVVASFRSEHADPFVAALGDAFYADADMVREAVKHKSMFNVIHLGTMMKVDVYIANTAFDRSAIARSQRDTIVPEDPAREFAIASAEDVILHKLRWFRDGGEMSDRQWSDILGVFRMQRQLDVEFMKQWAADLGVSDLLERAQRDAEIKK